jgi:hypothetical protein
MKTNYFSSKKMSIYSLFGLIMITTISCGSYQNKSYYDNDGIYGSNERKPVERQYTTNTQQPQQRLFL